MMCITKCIGGSSMFSLILIGLFFVLITGDIFEPYVPPEGDGKATTLSPEVSYK